MIIAFIGSREFKNIKKVREKLEEIRLIYNAENVKIISGGARGVDTEAIKIAKSLGFQTDAESYTPNFNDGYDVSKYHTRNDQIITDADKVIAFWDGNSAGSKSVIYKCLGHTPVGKTYLFRDVEVVFDAN